MGRERRLTKKQQAELDWAKRLHDLLREPYRVAVKRQRTYSKLAHAVADAFGASYDLILDLEEGCRDDVEST